MYLILQQFLILLWKSLLMRKRHYITTIFEVILPLLTSLIVVIVVFKLSTNAESVQKNQIPEKVSTGESIFWKPAFDFNLCFNGFYDDSQVIYFAPKNAFTAEIVAEMESLIRKHSKKGMPPTLEGFDSEDDLVAKWMLLNRNKTSSGGKPELMAAIVFPDTATIDAESQFSYKIRSRAYDMKTDALFPTITIPGPNRVDSLYARAFATIQVLVNEAYLNVRAQKLTPPVKREPTGNLLGMKFPFPAYETQDSGKFTFIVFLPVIIIFGFIVSFPIIVKRIADEKVNHTREMFRMMGLSDWVYWGSTFVNFFGFYAIQALILTILYVIKFNGVSAVLNTINPFLFFVILLIYGASFIMLAMLISVPFSRPTIAVVLAVVLWTVSYYLPVFFVDPLSASINVRSTATARILSCLIPNMGLNFAFKLIAQNEINGVDTTFGNLYDEVTIFGNLTMGLVLGMMLISCLMSGVLIWYLDAVWPWQDGVPQPFYFPFTRTYWCGSPSSSGDLNDDVKDTDPKFYERQLSSSETCISIKNLRKVFGYSFNRKVAVENVSLNISHGQITCLLGHNGAGKTTTMNMITGIFPATSGSITVNGFDVSTQTRDARRSISLCPQHNVLYDELTVAEHLKLYAAIKGVKWSELTNEVRKTVEQIQLSTSSSKMSTTLSGGMKRKLSMGIALIGGTKTVILDEPTSGMDPDARRSVWDLLLSIRSQRTILLTTHFMEEADALGDRIAIMASGEVKCCGSPMFLKKVFGTGYQLRVAKGLNYKGNQLSQMVTKHFPRGSLKSEIETEVLYSLESEVNVTDTSKLPQFFNDLERDKQRMGIASCGLSVTTMEDVFLKVGSLIDNIDEDTYKENGLPTNGHSNGDLHVSGYSSTEALQMDPEGDQPHRLSGMSLTLQRFRGLFLKRFHYSRRYWPMIVFQIVIPSLVFILILYLNNVLLAETVRNPPLNLNLKSMYGNTNGFYQSDDSRDSLQKYYVTSASSEGLTVTVLDKSETPNDYLINVGKTVPLGDYKKHYLVGASVNHSAEGRVYGTWFNNEAYHSLPASVNILYEAMANELFESNSASIQVINHPLPSDDDVFNSLNQAKIVSMMWATMVPLTIPFLAASYVMFPVHERMSKAKLLQLMSGLNPGLFWLASVVFDFCTHLISCLLIFIIFALMDSHGIFMQHSSSGFGLFLMLVTFGLASIPLAYVFAPITKKPATGFALLVIVYIISGIIFAVAATFLQVAVIFGVTSPELYKGLLWAFRVSPVFSLTWGIKKLVSNGLEPAACDKIPAQVLTSQCNSPWVSGNVKSCCKDICGDYCSVWQNPMQWGDKGILDEFLMMLASCLLFTLILGLMELNVERFFYTLVKRIRGGDNVVLVDASGGQNIPNGSPGELEDSDVVTERHRVSDLVNQGSSEQEALLVMSLFKKFNRFAAVNKLSFGVHPKECFGLLGVNGAGKTTTFRMLTGDLFPDQGNAFMGQLDIKNRLKSFQQQLGYCPQFDALLDKLTGREMLYLFGRLRGIPESRLCQLVKEFIELTDLRVYADKTTETYSGGNKRKLSLAIALIGAPQLLLLDEPTSGVDPGARRKIWKTLVYIREKYGCSIILTSHSMEECEALCSRVAIMVNGQFKCIGSTQHLRTKYGQGFTLIIKLKREMVNDVNYIALVQRYVQGSIASAVLRDVHETVIHYHITDPSVSWAFLFEVMEKGKREFNLEDYLVSDTTLEQIFIAFARHQSQQTVQ